MAALGFAQDAKVRLSQSQDAMQAFRQRIEQEFTVKSEIDLDLFAATVHIVADVEALPGGEIVTPIHDALNWRYTRFGHQSRSAMYAALLLQESGELWQAKLSTPRLDEDKTRKKLRTKLGRVRSGDIKALAKIHPDCAEYIKYETQIGNGSRAFLPAIPAKIRKLISKRYGVEVPLTGSFWDWLQQHREIPLVFTEGGKKALSLLSLGYVAIALYGVNGGYRKVASEYHLISDIERFAVAGRKVAIAFDQDAKLELQRRVNAATARFGGLLKQSACDVAIVSWDGQQGKGADDLIVNCGADAFHSAYDAALSLNHWQLWQRLEKRLTWKASIRVNQADLSTLEVECLPVEGIIALSSAKGTGKTKFLAETIKLSESVLSAGHRIALMRNLCQRLGCDYRGDLDRVNGQFINGSGYALRIGFCVDALLAIDPEKFIGCDLVIDEVVQVLRHLLMSATCQKDGMRPLLLARFVQLVRMARRVIVADADLDNATLQYLQQIRGNDAPVFLIRNDYQATGYNVRFIESADDSAIISELLADIGSLPQGKTIFIAVDDKGEAIDQVIRANFPNKRVLLINSKTSGSEIEQAFIKTPDSEIEKYDVVIASPSLATGVSIEVQSVIHRVYGIFSGKSISDVDGAQSLIRVRELVDRVVWCARRGSNFNKVSRSTNPIELKSHLQQQTSVAASLVKLSLQDTTQDAISAYDWAGDAHLNLYCRFASEQNRSMWSFRDALQVRLKHEGHRVTVEQIESDADVRLLLKSARAHLKQLDAAAVANADDLTYVEVAALEKKESRSPDEELAIAKFHLKDFYALDEITIDEVLADNKGRRRSELLNLEAQLYSDLAIDRTAKSFEKQASWNSGNCPWDVSQTALRQWLRSQLGLNDFLTLDRAEWTKYDLAPYADRAREIASQIKTALHFTITDRMSDVQIVHQLLSQLGVKVASRHSRAVPGHEGEKLRLYFLHIEVWQSSIDILDRRKAKRDRLLSNSEDAASVGSPPHGLRNKQGGEPILQNLQLEEDWLAPESLADVKLWLEAAAADPSDSTWEELLSQVPSVALERAVLAA